MRSSEWLKHYGYRVVTKRWLLANSIGDGQAATDKLHQRANELDGKLIVTTILPDTGDSFLMAGDDRRALIMKALDVMEQTYED